MSTKTKTDLAVVILAAGKGTRMKSDLPKVMHKLAGLPMINWLLQTVEQLKPTKIVVVTGPDMPDLEAAVAQHKTTESIIQKDRNGTGGAARIAMKALKDFDGDILVLLGDTPLITKATLKNLVKTKGSDGLSVLGMEPEDPAGYGRLFLNPDGTLQRIIEHKDATPTERKIRLVNTGAFCLDGKKAEKWLKKLTNDNVQGEYYITDIPEIAAREGDATNVALATSPNEVLGCNSRVDLAKLEALVQDQLRTKAMEQGITMIDPQTVYLSYDTKIEQDVLIEPNVFFGPGVKVKSGTHIKAFSHLEGALVDKKVTLGPFARLRPDTVLGEEVRIGNFVEIKKSNIGKRSKVNHLGYVGDTTMGEDVNFSAGAITVNYDGFVKHKTVIGKNVMVGSNVNLVAPLSIDDGAFLAAGSTITEDVPADALSVERTRAEVRQGWAAQYRKLKARVKQKKMAAKK